MLRVLFVNVYRSRTCRLRLILPPFTFGLSEPGALRYWPFLLGAAVVLVAALGQDWTSVIASNRSRSESAGEKSPSIPEILFGPLF